MLINKKHGSNSKVCHLDEPEKLEEYFVGPMNLKIEPFVFNENLWLVVIIVDKPVLLCNDQYVINIHVQFNME